MYQAKFNRQFQHFHIKLKKNVHAFNTTPLWNEEKNMPVACCHSPEMLAIKMLSFEGKLQKQI
jgi:hypothetical protein